MTRKAPNASITWYDAEARILPPAPKGTIRVYVDEAAKVEIVWIRKDGTINIVEKRELTEVMS